MLTQIKLYDITASDGTKTITSDVRVKGKLFAVEWIDGDLADGVDAVLSCVRDDNATDITLLTLTNANNDAIYYPRHQVHSNVGAALTLDGTRIAYTEPLVNGFLKLAITDGGDTKTGGCIAYVCDD